MGKTLFRTLYTGHYHHKKKIEYITAHENTGFMLKILPSLSRTDYYHYHISEVPVVDLSPGDRVLNLLSCLPWTGARARLVPRCQDLL